METTRRAPRGGAFLTGPLAPEDQFTPEEFDQESRLIGQAAEEFVRGQVWPVVKRLDSHEEGLLETLFQQMGELGLFGVETPTIYGGLQLDKTTVALLVETLGQEPSICLTHQAHAGLATFPLLFFGSKAQKEKYLPKLASGEWGASYCLSEPNSGSDALGAQTRATLSADGKTYTLNGSKMWVTNASFAKLFTVFAKIDVGQFTGFLVERDTPGLEPAREEDKIGLKGSSTRRVQLENVEIPVENRLGDPGMGYKAAFNTLNMGRFKMAASALGAGKHSLATAAAYANQRHQFGRPIASFGQMQHKLGEMTARLFALESMVYRTAGLINAAFKPIDHAADDAGEQYLKAASEYAIECSIIKVFGTETQYYCADEGLQIHGGYGYTEDFPIARQFRDGRIPRVYEGTNEINRIVIAQMLVKRGLIGSVETNATDEMDRAVQQLKWAANTSLGWLHDAYGDDIREQQEALACGSDLVILAYAGESALTRYRKSLGSSRLAEACVRLTLLEAIRAGRNRLHELACAVHPARSGEAIEALTLPDWDGIALRRQLATEVSNRERYLF